MIAASLRRHPGRDPGRSAAPRPCARRGAPPDRRLRTGRRSSRHALATSAPDTRARHRRTGAGARSASARLARAPSAALRLLRRPTRDHSRTGGRFATGRRARSCCLPRGRNVEPAEPSRPVGEGHQDGVAGHAAAATRRSVARPASTDRTRAVPSVATKWPGGSGASRGGRRFLGAAGTPRLPSAAVTVERSGQAWRQPPRRGARSADLRRPRSRDACPCGEHPRR